MFEMLKDDKGRLDSSKIWMHICYAAITYAFYKKGGNVTWEDIFAYGGVVGGSYLTKMWLKLRTGGGTEYGMANKSSRKSAE